MDRSLWLISSAAMAALLILLILRALQELLGVQTRLPVPAEDVPGGAAFPVPGPVVFAAALAILWLGGFAAYCAQSGGPEGFLSYWWERSTTTGDASYYLFIAENGYVSQGDMANAIVFYPLYPLAIRCVGTLLGGRYALAGVAVSQVCFGSSAVMLAKLAQKECAHPGAALAAFLLYPFGFFCLGVFTEGLFLLLTVSGLYLIRQRRWLAAGAVGALAALTRLQGVLLLLPGVYCAWRQVREDRRWSWRYLALAGPLAGFGVYLCLNRAVCGDFFAFNAFQSAPPWYQSIQWLGDTIVQQVHMARQYPDLALWIYWPQLALYFIGAAALLLGFRQGLDTAWLLYGTAYLGMCYTAGWLISGGRYMLGCLPLYLVLGRMKRPVVRYTALAAEALVFWQMYVWFIQGQAIM